MRNVYPANGVGLCQAEASRFLAGKGRKRGGEAALGARREEEESLKRRESEGEREREKRGARAVFLPETHRAAIPFQF